MLCELIANGHPTGAPLIIEGIVSSLLVRLARPHAAHLRCHSLLVGRQPAVMASFMQRRMNKPNCVRIYLTCSVREQALRFLEREVRSVSPLPQDGWRLNRMCVRVGWRGALSANVEGAPERQYESLHEVADEIKKLVRTLPVHGAMCLAPLTRTWLCRFPGWMMCFRSSSITPRATTMIANATRRSTAWMPRSTIGFARWMSR